MKSEISHFNEIRPLNPDRIRIWILLLPPDGNTGCMIWPVLSVLSQKASWIRFFAFFFGVIDSQSSYVKATRERETTYKKVEGQHTLISLLSHHYLIPILYYHQFKDTWPTQKRHKTTGQILGHSVLMQNCRSIHQNSTMYVILYDSCINKKFKYSEKENSEFNYYHAFYIDNVYTVSLDY